MTADEQDALLDRLTAMAEYYERPKSDAQLMLYVQGLADLPFPGVAGALSVLLKTSTFFPKIAEIRELVGGDVEAQAEDAWAELHGEIRRVGSWRAPQLSAATWATVELLCGTWERCVATIGRAEAGPEIQGWQKRWKESYGHTAGKLERGELIGREEAAQILGSIRPKQLPGADERTVPTMPEGVSVAGDVQHARRRGV